MDKETWHVASHRFKVVSRLTVDVEHANINSIDFSDLVFFFYSFEIDQDEFVGVDR